MNEEYNSKYDIEAGLISKLMETRDLSSVRDLQIRSSFFTGENRRVFNFINRSFMELGEFPTLRSLERKFPGFEYDTHEVNGEEVIGTDESLLYWCKEIRTKNTHNLLAETTEKMAELLDSFETEKAKELYERNFFKLENEVELHERTDLTDEDSVETRIDRYLERKRNQGIMGIPTGISELDYLLKGLVKDTLTTLIAKTGLGKAVTLDTDIITPDGVVKMRDIKVGSKVFDEKGNICNVIAVHPQGLKEVYRVTFEDGCFVDCCKDHLWKFKTIDDVQRGKPWRVETVEQMLKRHVRRGKGVYNYRIPRQEAIELPYSSLPLDPYVFGCLLGDGGFTTDRISFTNPEADIVEDLNDRLSNWGEFKLHKGNDIQYLFKSNNPKNNRLYRTIKEMGFIGIKSKDKYIPDEYLWSSKEQRLLLAQGIIDTDGSVNEKGHISFSTSSNKLAEGFVKLIQSLGYRCTRHIYREEENVIHILGCDDKLITSKKHLERFNNRKRPNKEHDYSVVRIKSIEKLGYTEEMQCITVDSPYSTFLCGDYIVTHNTWLLVIIGAYAMLNNYKVMVFVTEMSRELMEDRFDAALYGFMYGGFSYSKFKKGDLDPDVEDKFFQFLRNDITKLERLVIEDAPDVASVISGVQREKPDLVMVDSAYLMDDGQKTDADWLRVAHITRSLKKDVAKRFHVPVFINSQADKSTSKKTGPSMDNISFAQTVGQDSDNVIAAYRDEVMFSDNEMGIKVLKNREGMLGKAVINWDFQTMNFSGIYGEREGEANVDSSVDMRDNIIGVDD